MLTQRYLQAQRLNVVLQPLSQDQLELQLQGFFKKETMNISSRLGWLKHQPREKQKINILFCLMIYLQVVRPFIEE